MGKTQNRHRLILSFPSEQEATKFILDTAGNIQKISKLEKEIEQLKAANQALRNHIVAAGEQYHKTLEEHGIDWWDVEFKEVQEEE